MWKVRPNSNTYIVYYTSGGNTMNIDEFDKALKFSEFLESRGARQRADLRAIYLGDAFSQYLGKSNE